MLRDFLSAVDAISQDKRRESPDRFGNQDEFYDTTDIDATRTHEIEQERESQLEREPLVI